MESTTALYALRRLRIKAEHPDDAMGFLLPTSSVAEWLGVSIGTLAKWRRRGEGPAWFQLGRGRTAHIRYPVGDVLAWLEEIAAGNGGPTHAGPAASA